MKRFRSLALLLAAVFLAAALPAPGRRAAADTAEPADAALTFDANGQFTVLVLADAQDTQYTVPYLGSSTGSVLDAYPPDLVVLLGDQIAGYHPLIRLGDNEAHVRAAIDNILSPIVSRGIPFAVVFGNHDAESGVTRERQMEIYRSYPGCLAVDEGEALPGCGTYVLTVRDDSGKPALNLFFFDSGDYAEDGGYACVTAEQVEWYREQTESFRLANGYQNVPAVAFQHIIVAEIYTMLDEVEKGTDGALAGKGFGAGGYYAAKSERLLDGVMNEAPCPSSENHGQYQAFREEGDVFAAFFGHDHVNTFLAVTDGPDLVACPGATYTSYNNRAVRGVRLLRFSSDNVQDYETLLVPFSWYESVSLFGTIAYYFLTTTHVPNAAKVLLLALALLAAVVLLLTHGLRKKAEPPVALAVGEVDDDGFDPDPAETEAGTHPSKE